jgi:hypothetical protein
MFALHPVRCTRLLSLALVVGCGDATAPSTRVLEGQWGDETREVVASATGAEFRLGCVRLLMDRPIALRLGNTFTAQAEVGMVGTVAGGRVTVTGRLRGAELTFTAPVAGTLTFRAGVRPDPGVVHACPA